LVRWREENQVFEQMEGTSLPDMVAMSDAGSPECVGFSMSAQGYSAY
jgi:hypothetical protein